VLRSAQESGERLTEPVRLGVVAAAVGPRLRSIIAIFEASYPHSQVQVVGLPFRDRFGPLRRGEVQRMVTHLPLDHPGLVIGPVLAREQPVLAVARNHPLATRHEVSAEDLVDHRVGRLDIGVPTELNESLTP
jgi:DNA-binding transcriptional LysR family regulator